MNKRIIHSYYRYIKGRKENFCQCSYLQSLTLEPVSNTGTWKIMSSSQSEKLLFNVT